jgi:hypothetical protein
MGYDTAFSFSQNDIYEPIPSDIGPDTVKKYITIAKTEVEEQMKLLLYRRVRSTDSLNQTLVSQTTLPAQELDVMLAASYPLLKRKMAYRTLELIYQNIAGTEAKAEQYHGEYKAIELADLMVYADLDVSGTVDSNERQDGQDMLDNFIR